MSDSEYEQMLEEYMDFISSLPPEFFKNGICKDSKIRIVTTAIGLCTRLVLEGVSVEKNQQLISLLEEELQLLRKSD